MGYSLRASQEAVIHVVALFVKGITILCKVRLVANRFLARCTHQTKLVGVLKMFKQIQAVYKEADIGAFDDKICLEVMLRNVAIREGYRMDKKDAVRVIELERKNEDGVKQ